MADPTDDIYDPDFVKDVFDRCSNAYILFSTVMSFGFTERWRRQCAQALPDVEMDAPLCFDLMSGTGEVWPHLRRARPDIAEIRAIDISSGMHERALQRISERWADTVTFQRADVLAADLEDGSADMIVSTFGLKTFNDTQQQTLARLTARLLRPGGAFSFVEASDPKGWVLRPLYRFYLHGVLPLIERFILRGATDFRMLGVYTANFGDARGFAKALEDCGLEVTYTRYVFGCATGVSGRKPRAR